MEIRAFAERVLFSPALEDKLARPDRLTDRSPGPPRARPALPTRAPGQAVAPSGQRAPLTKLSPDTSDKERGLLLHSFANHELLAMEAMAAALLSFPEAEPAFRRQLAVALTEEQTHFRLYQGRMAALGVEFGERPLNGYFWRALADAGSLSSLVSRLNLTFEQANLDFAAFYRARFSELGDTETAEVLGRVLKDEIGHVALGVRWFERWQERSLSFSDYRAALPPGFSAARARGPVFLVEERRRAGLSEAFIEQLRLHKEARSRPPVVWCFNAGVELSLRQRPRPLKAGAQALRADLTLGFGLLAAQDDLLLLPRMPSQAHRARLAAAGLCLPELVEAAPGEEQSALQGRKLGGLSPWGEGPEPAALRGRLGLAPARAVAPALYDKRTAKRLFFDFCAASASPLFGPEALMGEVVEGLDALADASARAAEAGVEQLVVKHPLDSSGRGQRRLAPGRPLDASTEGWLRRGLKEEGGFVVEPWLDRVLDLSLLLTVSPERRRPRQALFTLLNHPGGAYLGHRLGPPLAGLDPALRRRLNQLHPAGFMAGVDALSEFVAAALSRAGFAGPAEVDMMLFSWRGQVYLRPIVELNPRRTMGSIARALAPRVAPKRHAALLQLRLGAEGAAAQLSALSAGLPWQQEPGEGGRILQGLLPIGDPEGAEQALLCLVVAPEAAGLDALVERAATRPERDPSKCGKL